MNIITYKTKKIILKEREKKEETMQHINILFEKMIEVDNNVPHIDEDGIDVYLYDEEFYKDFIKFCLDN